MDYLHRRKRLWGAGWMTKESQMRLDVPVEKIKEQVQDFCSVCQQDNQVKFI